MAFDELVSSGDLAAGDLNGDHDADVVTILWDGEEISHLGVRLGNGRGGFGSVRLLAVPNASDPSAQSLPSAVALADINGDGRTDVVSANASGSVAAFLNDRRGRLVLSSNVVVPSNLAAGQPGIVRGPLVVSDFNEDGALDALAINQLVLSLVVGDGRGGFTFAAHVDLGDGDDSPLSFQSADLNGDGHLDLALVDHLGRLCIADGAGDGSFTLRGRTELEWPALTLALGDVNGDGRPDIAVNGYQGATVLLNESGNFVPTAPIDDGERSTSGSRFVIADLTSDGHADLAVLGWGSSVSVLEGNGRGGFGAARDFLVGPSPQAMVASDLDGRGHVALVTSNSGAFYVQADPKLELTLDNWTEGGHGTLSVLARSEKTGDFDVARNYDLGGSSTGNFFSAPEGTVVDLDADGVRDVLVPVALDGATRIAISLVTGDGRGGFAAPQALATVDRSVGALRTGDFNHDGRTDIVTGNLDQGEGLSLLLALPQSGFAPSRTITSEAIGDPALIDDLDGDGNLDVGAFVGGIPLMPGFNPIVQDRSELRLFLGDGNGAFQAGGQVDLFDAVRGTAARRVAAADFNRDGRLDLVWAGSTPTGTEPRLNTVTVLKATGAGHFQPQPPMVLDRDLRDAGPLGVADFNGDGWADLVLARSAWALLSYGGTWNFGGGGPGKLTVLLGSARGFRAPRHFETLGADALAIADFNGDQVPDIAVLNGRRALIEVWLGDGTGRFNAAPAFDSGMALEGFIAAGDLNRDGRVDLVSVNQNSVNASVFLNLTSKTVR